MQGASETASRGNHYEARHLRVQRPNEPITKGMARCFAAGPHWYHIDGFIGLEAPMTNSVPQGWQCPCCSRVFSPSTAMCCFCGPETMTEHAEPRATSFPPRKGSWYAHPHKDVPTEGGTPIETLDLPVRVSNCLKCEDIFTIEQLQCWSIRKLAGIPNLGKKSLQDLEEQLGKINITLKDW